VLAHARLTVPFRSIGFPDEETVPGTQAEILEHYGMSAVALADAARNLLRAGREREGVSQKTEALP
jgi:transketolase